MNTLRLILLLLGATVIVGVYIWDRLQARQAQHRARDRYEAFDAGDLDLKISARRGDEEEEDVAPVLAALRRGQGGDTEVPSGPVTLGGQADENRESGEPAAAVGSIISLHVVADPGTSFNGAAILNLMRELGLEFGDMNIFHCFGMEGMRGRRPWFHLANMLEPGSFDPDAMQEFSTRGLSLFMQLPAPVDGDVALDLMLDTARQLAEHLGGRVMTHDRRPLTETYIKGLRGQINHNG